MEDVLYELTKIACENYETISVGSGTGDREYIFQDKLNQKIICVDPNNSWKKTEIKIHPHYSYVKDLINEKPVLIDNCCLLLYWPLFNENIYDIEAVNLLKPKTIIVYYESLGGAGGTLFHNFLKDSGAPSGLDDIFVRKLEYKSLYPDLKKYKLIKEKSIHSRSMFGPGRTTCAFLAQENMEFDTSKFKQIDNIKLENNNPPIQKNSNENIFSLMSKLSSILNFGNQDYPFPFKYSD